MNASEAIRNTDQAVPFKRWDSIRTTYACADTIDVAVRHGKSAILLKKGTQALVSGALFGRDMRTVARSAEDAKTVTLPRTTSEIGPGAFKRLGRLHSAVLCEGVRMISREAFAWSRVARVRLPTTLRKIGKESFHGCRNLRRLQLPDGTEVLDELCFAASGLVEIAVLRGVREIRENAFYACADLKSVTFHEESALQKIGKNCFMRSGVVQVTLPRGLAVLEEGVFGYCQGLRRVQFQQGSVLRVVEKNCFQDSGIEEFAFPAGVREVQEFAFYGCKSLKHVTLNEGLETLGTRAFSRTGLESLALPGTLKELDDSFADCEGIRTVILPAGRLTVTCDQGNTGYSGRLVIGSSVRELLFHPAHSYFGVAEVAFEEDCELERIGPNAFQSTRLESFAAPDSLREVGWMAFGNCKLLRDVALNGGLEALGDLCFWGTQVRQLRLPGLVGKTLAQLGAVEDAVLTIALPEGLESVGYRLFADSDIREVVVSASVVELGAEAFRGCKNLRRVTFSEGSRLKTIRRRCFQASGIEGVTIPAGVTELQDETFSDCGKLKRVEFQKGCFLESVGDSCFCKSGVEAFEAPDSLREIGAYAFQSCADLRRAVLNDGLQMLGHGAFQRSGLESVRLPQTLERLECATFLGCGKLRHVDLPGRLEEIGANCFRESGLESVFVPASVHVLGNQAFYGCSRLARVEFAEGIRLWEVRAGVFGRCLACLDQIRVPQLVVREEAESGSEAE